MSFTSATMEMVAWPSGMERADRAVTFTLAVDRAIATSRVRLSRSLADSSREVL